MNIQYSNNENVVVVINRVWLNGKELPPVPSKCRGRNITTIDGKVYIDGYEFKKGKWRRTLRAFYHLWF